VLLDEEAALLRAGNARRTSRFAVSGIVRPGSGPGAGSLTLFISDCDENESHSPCGPPGTRGRRRPRGSSAQKRSPISRPRPCPERVSAGAAENGPSTRSKRRPASSGCTTTSGASSSPARSAWRRRFFSKIPRSGRPVERPFGEVLQSGGVLAHEAEQATLRDGIRHHWRFWGPAAGKRRSRECCSSSSRQVPRPGGAPGAAFAVLGRVCGQAARFWLHRSAHAESSEPAASAAPAEQWTLALFDSLKAAEVAAVAANECRRLLAVDRVSV